MPKTSPDAPVQAELCIGSLDSTTPLRVMAPLKGIPWRVAVSQDQKYVAVMVGNVATIYDFQSQKELARCLGYTAIESIPCDSSMAGGCFLPVARIAP